MLYFISEQKQTVQLCKKSSTHELVDMMYEVCSCWLKVLEIVKMTQQRVRFRIPAKASNQKETGGWFGAEAV